MFSNRVCFSTNHSLVFSHLQSTGNITSDPIVVNGVSWCCLFQWKEDYLVFTFGLRQPSDGLTSCVVQASVKVHNSSYRCRYSTRHLLTCTDEWHSDWYIGFSQPQIQLLLDYGKLNITVHWQIYKPINIRSLSPTGTFSFPAPKNCMNIAGEMDGFVYLLVRSNMQECCICSLSIFNPDRVFTLARLPIRTGLAWLVPDKNQIGVMRRNRVLGKLWLDVLWLDDCHLERRVYNIPAPDRDLRLYAEMSHGKCWICSGRAMRWDADDDAQSKRVHFKFWSLGDDGQMRLLTHLARPTRSVVPKTASIVNDHFYCFVSSPKGHLFVFVSSWEQPHIWQPYELAPSNFSPFRMVYNCRSLFLCATIINARGPLEENKTDRKVLVEMRFEGADCLLEPALALPKGLPVNWLMAKDVLLCFERQRNMVSVLQLQPPKLKIEALLSVQRQLGVRDGQDNFGRPVWKEWRGKLTHLLEESKISLI